jgi:hypothetical protein
MSAFTPEEYRHDGGFSIAGLPLLAGVLLVTGVALGALVSFIGRWFYLHFFFAFLMGLGLACVAVMAAHSARMRNRGLAVLLGVASTAVTLLAMHYFDYRHWIAGRDAHFAEMGEKMAADVAADVAAEAAVNSLPGYLDFKAREGLTIAKRAGGGWNVGYYGTWIYWCVEFLVMAGIVAWAMIGRAQAPFCRTCDTWKEERRLGRLQGETDKVVTLLKEGDVQGLGKQKPAADGPLLLSAAVCPNCKDQASIAVKLQKVTRNDKGEESKSELVHLSYPGEALAAFEALFAGPEGKN